MQATTRASIARHRPPPGAYQVWSPSGNSYFWTTDEAQRVGGQLQAQEEAGKFEAFCAHVKFDALVINNLAPQS